MKILYLRHVPFEGPAGVGEWAASLGYQQNILDVYKNNVFPEHSTYDMLVILGGPMNIYEEDVHPWLREEKIFIKEAIDRGKYVLGICLGGQLIASVLGARVTRNTYKEIGWFPVNLTDEGQDLPLFAGVSSQFTAFHWHGDTFEIPTGAVRIAQSQACANQGFVFNGRVIGLQFHLEYTGKSIEDMIVNCGDEIVEGLYIQDREKILSTGEKVDAGLTLLYTLLNRFVSV